MQQQRETNQGSQVEKPEDYRRCVAFHGHECPGLAIGYRAARAALAALRQERADDEEMVAIVETDACGVDAIQVLTGCTFGKGNLIYRDYGKQAFTFLVRPSGQGVRVVLKARATEPDERHQQLRKKIGDGTATDQESAEFWKLHGQKAREILQRPLEGLFTIQPLVRTPPPKARMDSSRLCSRCGEPVMGSKLTLIEGRDICRGCLKPEEEVPS